jgi:hypothetical protein
MFSGYLAACRVYFAGVIPSCAVGLTRFAILRMLIGVPGTPTLLTWPLTYPLQWFWSSISVPGGLFVVHTCRICEAPIPPSKSSWTKTFHLVWITQPNFLLHYHWAISIGSDSDQSVSSGCDWVHAFRAAINYIPRAQDFASFAKTFRNCTCLEKRLPKISRRLPFWSRGRRLGVVFLISKIRMGVVRINFQVIFYFFLLKFWESSA